VAAALTRQVQELRRANAELRQFADIVAHDFQEPLRMVSTYVHRLAQRSQGTLDAEAQEFCGLAVDGAQRMQSLLQALLAYTRIGETRQEWAVVDGEALLEHTARDLRLMLEEQQAEMTHDPLPKVRGNDKQLGLVFQNLLSNALKFCGSASPWIHVSARQEGPCWVLSVRDNGIGLDSRQSERIFQVFQRLHTPQEYPGTGIGLAICKKVIERHGGRIWVESKVGKGATFFFSLPAP
jgi:light-regulated signal transduction histidine kinase (bacteriophytochrome)